MNLYGGVLLLSWWWFLILEFATTIVAGTKEHSSSSSRTLEENHSQHKDECDQNPDAAASVCSSFSNSFQNRSDDDDDDDDDDEKDDSGRALDHEQQRQQEDEDEDEEEDEEEWMSEECGLILSTSSIPDAGLGVFVGRPKVTRGQAVLSGDVVLQVHDLPAHYSLRFWLHVYGWDARKTGGIYEGLKVVSHVPGVGCLANGMASANHTTAIPFVPRVDEGGLTRLDAPGAGAISHYHNYTWFYLKNMTAGEELFINYGSEWFQERQTKLGIPLLSELPPPSQDPQHPQHSKTKSDNHDDNAKPRLGYRPLASLRRDGRCLDTLISGPSRLPGAGRGAFLRFPVPANKIVQAVCVIPIAKQALIVQRAKSDTREFFQGWQLLLNYVLGHEESSTVLIPCGPLFSLINHAPTKGPGPILSQPGLQPPQQYQQPHANVRLQWSKSKKLFPNAEEWLSNNSTWDLWTRNSSGLLLELVALRDLHAGEELYLNYGSAWQEKWNEHVKSWKPPPDAESYAPSYVHDDAIANPRTERELKQLPYPNHIFTSCFYPVNETTMKLLTAAAKQKQHPKHEITTVPWRMTRGLFEYENLRPCRILERHATRMKDVYVYTVQILNRYGLRPDERLPSPLLVTAVPRKAIRFSDKIYTTDQHLPNAFRHPIHLPDDVFPEAWKDLKKTSDSS